MVDGATCGPHSGPYIAAVFREERCSIVSNRDQIRHFPTDVVGVSLNNDDGTSRQEIINRCRRFERLSLEPEEGTPRDLPGPPGKR